MITIRFSWYILCVLVLLCAASVESQRGRTPPPHAKSRPFTQDSSLAAKISSQHGSAAQGKCEIINGVNTCSPPDNGLFKFSSFFISGALIVVGFIYKKKREIWIIKDVFKNQMSKFEQKILEIPCKVKESELNNKILSFQNTVFQIDDIRKDKIQHYKSQMRIVNLQKVRDRIYEVKYQCRDINGEGSLQGLVAVVSQNQYAVKLVKIYKKFTEMGTRTKKMKNLMFYEGRGSLKQITGEWHFIGFEDTYTHSGTWKMASL